MIVIRSLCDTSSRAKWAPGCVSTHPTMTSRAVSIMTSGISAGGAASRSAPALAASSAPAAGRQDCHVCAAIEQSAGRLLQARHRRPLVDALPNLIATTNTAVGHKRAAASRCRCACARPATASARRSFMLASICWSANTPPGCPIERAATSPPASDPVRRWHPSGC